MTGLDALRNLSPGEAAPFNQAALHLALLRCGQDAGLIELRWKVAGGMRQAWFAAHEREDAARKALRLSELFDVYAGAALRARCGGTRDDLLEARCLWADVDTPDALERLARFDPAPSMVVASGSPGCAHAWWSIAEALRPAHAEIACRRLAHALGADMRSTDQARIMRLAGTKSHKGERPAPVELIALNIAPNLTAADVVGGLRDPDPEPVARIAPPASRSGARAGRSHDDDHRSQALALNMIARYAPGTELREGAGGRLHGRCPFPDHEDRNPSFVLFPDGGWACSCGTGDVYRLYARLTGQPWADRDLPRLRRELHEVAA